MAKTILLNKLTNPSVDSPNRYRKLLSHLTFGLTIINHFFKSFSINRNYSPIKYLVVKGGRMLAMRVAQFEVFNPIVGCNSINMVNALSLSKGTTNILRHYVNVLKNTTIFIRVGVTMNIKTDVLPRLEPTPKVFRSLSFFELSFNAVRNTLNKSSKVVPFFFHGNNIAYMTEVVNG